MQGFYVRQPRLTGRHTGAEDNGLDDAVLDENSRDFIPPRFRIDHQVVMDNLTRQNRHYGIFLSSHFIFLSIPCFAPHPLPIFHRPRLISSCSSASLSSRHRCNRVGRNTRSGETHSNPNPAFCATPPTYCCDRSSTIAL